MPVAEGHKNALFYVLAHCGSTYDVGAALRMI
jgi:hypothetical protein